MALQNLKLISDMGSEERGNYNGENKEYKIDGLC